MDGGGRGRIKGRSEAVMKSTRRIVTKDEGGGQDPDDLGPQGHAQKRGFYSKHSRKPSKEFNFLFL